MKEENWILNSFRLFIDLQGYSWDEIPDSFLFDQCIKFCLTDENNEDMEGFNDVWANILNDDILQLPDNTFSKDIAAVIDKDGVA